MIFKSMPPEIQSGKNVQRTHQVKTNVKQSLVKNQLISVIQRAGKEQYKNQVLHPRQPFLSTGVNSALKDPHDNKVKVDIDSLSNQYTSIEKEISVFENKMLKKGGLIPLKTIPFDKKNEQLLSRVTDYVNFVNESKQKHNGYRKPAVMKKLQSQKSWLA